MNRTDERIHTALLSRPATQSRRDRKTQVQAARHAGEQARQPQATQARQAREGARREAMEADYPLTWFMLGRFLERNSRQKGSPTKISANNLASYLASTQGSSPLPMVELGGLEPPTCSLRTNRATTCAIAPGCLTQRP